MPQSSLAWMNRIPELAEVFRRFWSKSKQMTPFRPLRTADKPKRKANKVSLYQPGRHRRITTYQPKCPGFTMRERGTYVRSWSCRPKYVCSWVQTIHWYSNEYFRTNIRIIRNFAYSNIRIIRKVQKFDYSNIRIIRKTEIFDYSNIRIIRKPEIFENSNIRIIRKAQIFGYSNIRIIRRPKKFDYSNIGLGLQLVWGNTYLASAQ